VTRSSSNKNKSKSHKKCAKARTKTPAPTHYKSVSRRVPTWIGKLEECASELNLGSRRIQQLAKEGLPRAERGIYDVVACFRWYVKYLQRKLVERALPEDGDGDAGGPVSSATATRHKILSIEAELAQISLAEKREQLISIDKATKDIVAIVTEIRTRILALPPRLAAEVLGETDLAVSQVKIDRSLKGALECLSQFDPDDDDRVVQAPRVV
jgi:phage terminase Nu1 subunit (DNA packaging protein)